MALPCRADRLEKHKKEGEREEGYVMKVGSMFFHFFNSLSLLERTGHGKKTPCSYVEDIEISVGNLTFLPRQILLSSAPQCSARL